MANEFGTPDLAVRLDAATARILRDTLEHAPVVAQRGDNLSQFTNLYSRLDAYVKRNAG